MTLSDFDYHLPRELIAQRPAHPRDSSRLLVLDRKTGNIEHRHFFDIVDFLKKGDVLVMNDTKVFPARLIGKRKGSGGKIEVFLLKEIENRPRARGEKTEAYSWQCLVGGKIRQAGQEVVFEQGLQASISKKNGDGTWEVAFNKQGRAFMQIVERIGQTPLPPYIKKADVKSKNFKNDDKASYQTVYADHRKAGSVAAPTAGLHFTKRLMNRLEKQGIDIEFITLHVGLGTFAPIKTRRIEDHKMHAEHVEIKNRTLGRILKAKKAGRRIIAVGTTSARALEAIAEIKNYELRIKNKNSELNFRNLTITDFSGFVDIFIYPPYKFRLVDGMVTNFHLPKSTLLMLVSALAGKQNIDRAYSEAIRAGYRFYSYGDAMLII